MIVMLKVMMWMIMIMMMMMLILLVGDLHMVPQIFRIRADIDDLWHTIQPGPFSENQAQWLTPQLCLVTVG